MGNAMSSVKQLSKILVYAAAVAFLCACTQGGYQSRGGVEAVANMDSLVSAEWLRDHIDDPDLLVIDATVLVEADGTGNLVSINGRSNHESGHIPGAVFADLMGELSDADSPLDFAIPAPQQFAEAMEALGVGDDSRVIIYDANGMSWAARVWWMLRWVGFDRAALLDGGIQAWIAAGGELTTKAANPPAKELTVKLRPELMADEGEVYASIEDEAITLIDALPAPHYRGEWAMYDRPGHIRGATNVPVPSLYDETGRFRPADELAALFKGDPGTRTVTYCGGGIAASSNAFVLTRLGFTNVAIYGASLQEWAANPDNPMDVIMEFEEEP